MTIPRAGFTNKVAIKTVQSDKREKNKKKGCSGLGILNHYRQLLGNNNRPCSFWLEYRLIIVSSSFIKGYLIRLSVRNILGGHISEDLQALRVGVVKCCNTMRLEGIIILPDNLIANLNVDCCTGSDG